MTTANLTDVNSKIHELHWARFLVKPGVCTENPIPVYRAIESAKLAQW